MSCAPVGPTAPPMPCTMVIIVPTLFIARWLLFSMMGFTKKLFLEFFGDKGFAGLLSWLMTVGWVFGFLFISVRDGYRAIHYGEPHFWSLIWCPHTIVNWMSNAVLMTTNVLTFTLAMNGVGAPLVTAMCSTLLVGASVVNYFAKGVVLPKKAYMCLVLLFVCNFGAVAMKYIYGLIILTDNFVVGAVAMVVFWVTLLFQPFLVGYFKSQSSKIDICKLSCSCRGFMTAEQSLFTGGALSTVLFTFIYLKWDNDSIFGEQTYVLLTQSVQAYFSSAQLFRDLFSGKTNAYVFLVKLGLPAAFALNHIFLVRCMAACSPVVFEVYKLVAESSANLFNGIVLGLAVLNWIDYIAIPVNVLIVVIYSKVGR